MSLHVDLFLSPYLCGYRKGFSTQQALISLLEKWKILLDWKGYAGAILMDPSKASDTLNHDLLIAKLHAFDFSEESLKLIKSYLTKRWQRINVNIGFSSWSQQPLLGVPQGSVLGPPLFNTYINDLIYIDKCLQLGDIKFHACDSDLEKLINRLEYDSSMLAIEWFESNYMKLNDDKCHFFPSRYKHEMIFAKVVEIRIWESEKQKLLGVTIDKYLKFEEHIL